MAQPRSHSHAKRAPHLQNMVLLHLLVHLWSLHFRVCRGQHITRVRPRCATSYRVSRHRRSHYWSALCGLRVDGRETTHRLTVACRFSWGMRGAYFPVIIRAFVIIFWDGLQAYWGGQAVAVTIGAIIPGFAHMKQTLAGGILLTKDFIGIIIYYVFFVATMRIPPERLQRPFIVSSVMFGGTLIGLLAWAVSNTHSGGPLFREQANPVHGGTGWAMLFGITAILGAWGGGTIGQSDWTRYANRPYAPTLSQLIAAPFCMTTLQFLCRTRLCMRPTRHQHCSQLCERRDGSFGCNTTLHQHQEGCLPARLSGASFKPLAIPL